MRYPKTSRRKISRKTHRKLKKNIFGGEKPDLIEYVDDAGDADDEFPDRQSIDPIKREFYSPDDDVEIRYPEKTDLFEMSNPMHTTNKNRQINSSTKPVSKNVNVFKSLQPAFLKVNNDRLTRKNRQQVPTFSRFREELKDPKFMNFVKKSEPFSLLYDNLNFLLDIKKESSISIAEKIEIAKELYNSSHLIYNKIEETKYDIPSEYFENARDIVLETQIQASLIENLSKPEPKQTNSWFKNGFFSFGGRHTRKRGRSTRKRTYRRLQKTRH